MGRREDGGQSEDRRGHHTLEVRRGTVVGVSGADVIVELGVRMQGVLSVRSFDVPPKVGQEYEFTLGGQEDGLWGLSLVEQPSLISWEELEVGSLVSFHVLRRRWGGLEGKIGKLHAFLPGSHGGVDREQDLDDLVGRILTCEVLEVDPQRQRAVVSHRVAKRRARESSRQREASALRIGQVVEGRVSRVEEYGVFVKFGAGVEGLIHVSNLSHERVEDAAAVLKLGDRVEAKVLQIKRGGKRIALGIKQLGENPWLEFERRTENGEIVEGVVTRLLDFGAFVSLMPGVEGLLPRSEMGLRPGQPAAQILSIGKQLSLRIVSLEASTRRLSLSLQHTDGASIAPDEVSRRADLATLAKELGAAAPGSVLGRRLREALMQKSVDAASSEAPGKDAQREGNTADAG